MSAEQTPENTNNTSDEITLENQLQREKKERKRVRQTENNELLRAEYLERVSNSVKLEKKLDETEEDNWPEDEWYPEDNTIVETPLEYYRTVKNKQVSIKFVFKYSQRIEIVVNIRCENLNCEVNSFVDYDENKDLISMTIDKFKNIIEKYFVGEITKSQELILKSILRFKLEEFNIRGLVVGIKDQSKINTIIKITPGEETKLMLGSEILTFPILVN